MSILIRSRAKHTKNDGEHSFTTPDRDAAVKLACKLRNALFSRLEAELLKRGIERPSKHDRSFRTDDGEAEGYGAEEWGDVEQDVGMLLTNFIERRLIEKRIADSTKEPA